VVVLSVLRRGNVLLMAEPSGNDTANARSPACHGRDGSDLKLIEPLIWLA